VLYRISKIINELEIVMVKSYGKAQGAHPKYFFGRREDVVLTVRLYIICLIF